MEKIKLVAIREGLPEDRNFILATFLRGLYYGQSWFSEIPKDIFMKEYHKVAEHILAKPDTQVSIACLAEDPEVILGYALTSKDGSVIHFLFVKSAWRGIGIGKSLIPSSVKYATHLTRVGLNMLRKHPTVQFQPFLI